MRSYLKLTKPTLTATAPEKFLDIFVLFSSIKKNGNFLRLTVTYHVSTTPSPWQPPLDSASMRLTLLDSTYERDHILISSARFSCSVVSNSLQPHGLQHAITNSWSYSNSCPSPTPRAHSDSCPLSRWCHPTILSSVVPFSSCHSIYLSEKLLF